MSEIESRNPASEIESSVHTGSVPLIVDLDGTLTKSDSMHEALLKMVSEKPAKILDVLRWLQMGKARFKEKLADQSILEVSALPLRAEVLELIDTARSDGRDVLLVSASNQRQVSRVSDGLGIFDEAVGSDAKRNLSGSEKADWLVDRFGEKGFDYVGDSKADLSVWPVARQAYSVGFSRNIQKEAKKTAPGIQHLTDVPESPIDQVRPYIKAMRPHQWLKNLLVLVPALAAHNSSALLPSFAAFCAFCLAASSIYLINDMLDLEVDRRHPRKQKRPFASGAIPVAHGVVQAGGLFLLSLLMASIIAPAFFLALLLYIALTTAYSLILKRKLMIDIWTLGTLYTIRLVAGGAASGVPLSEWLLAFSMFVFLALAAVKRMSELADLKARGLNGADGRGYRVSDLPVVLGVVLSAGYCSIVILSLYISNESVTQLYGQPKLLWLVCLMLLYWISRATIISFRGEMDDDPIVFALKDKISLFVFACCGVVFLLSAIL